MATGAATRKLVAPKPKTPVSKTPNAKSKAPKPRQTTLTSNGSLNGLNKSSPSNAANHPARTKSKQNTSILNFFQRTAQDSALFLAERNPTGQASQSEDPSAEELGWGDAEEPAEDASAGVDDETRFNEGGGSNKKRKLSQDNGAEPLPLPVLDDLQQGACTPPPPPEGPPDNGGPQEGGLQEEKYTSKASSGPVRRRVGPFLDDSDSEDDVTPSGDTGKIAVGSSQLDDSIQKQLPSYSSVPEKIETPIYVDEPVLDDDFEGMGDFDEDFAVDGEEFNERLWAENEQKMLEMAEQAFQAEGDLQESSASCPICNMALTGISDQEATVHVNNCLDGNPTKQTTPTLAPQPQEAPVRSILEQAKQYQQKLPKPPKQGQENPFTIGPSKGAASAFSKIMANNVEDTAWATAAASETAARGKPAHERTCPFYKILPGFSLCVDAFRYGAVQGCNGYFLSHFHSDHYVGLSSTWSHGPIYCSRVTGNLVRQQLRVDPKWVVDLEFDQKTEVPNTPGVQVTMISANHCPGSSLFLFEKAMGKGPNPRVHRILHCGDFRACRAHVEHPKLAPDLLDEAGKKIGQQKIDVCYLDTTYLNPKYAFPSQDDVIQACADMCVSLSKEKLEEADGWEKTKRARAGESMMKFIRNDTGNAADAENPPTSDDTERKPRGRLLVIIGTYSIGKERVCLGIARALKSKIYAPPNKQRICACLEDPELTSLLTTDPLAAQVHMTPLFEIRADTLHEYLLQFGNHFSRAVGFRPSGWNYRPPQGRFLESPSVQTILHSPSWKTTFSMKDLSPQRGSHSRASCFGVPYSEHSSFRELTMFCCALRIDRIIPTVNVGSAKSREKMKGWCDKWAAETKKNGLYRSTDDSGGW